VTDPSGNAVTGDGYMCFTPLGHVYYNSSASFDSTQPVNGVLQITVVQQDSTQTAGYLGIKRTVVVPSSGMARMISQ
jgi:hypothetical protein